MRRFMCYFITIGVPARHRQLVEALQKGRFRADPHFNLSVAQLFTSDDALFTLTDGHCSCALYIRDESTTAEADEGKARARYQRQGWSEAKISRALEAKRQARTATQRDDKRGKFCERIAGVVEAIGRVRLFVHMYSGDIDSENVGTAAHVTIRLADCVQQQGAFQGDTVVELVREARAD